MDQERVAQLARELGDAELAERLVSARAAAVQPVPDDVARRHLRAMTLAAGTAAAGAASVTTASSAAAATGAGAAASVGGAAAGGTVLGSLASVKLGVAAFATVVATAGGLGATGNLPDPAQRVVDEISGREDAADAGGDVRSGQDAGPTTEADTGRPAGLPEHTGVRDPEGAERSEGAGRGADTERAERAERADDVARDDDAADAPAGTPPRGRDAVGDGPAGERAPDVPTPPGTPAGPGPGGGSDQTTGAPDDGVGGTPGGADDAPGRQADAPGRPADPGSPSPDAPEPGAPGAGSPGRSGDAPGGPGTAGPDTAGTSDSRGTGRANDRANDRKADRAGGPTTSGAPAADRGTADEASPADDPPGEHRGAVTDRGR